jgi:DNA-binding NarL/FixJ family response regulator
MSARVAVAVLAALTILANLLLGVGWALALAAGIAVFGVGETAGWLLRKRSRPDIPSATGSHPLSPREVEVAVLIAQGLTSKEVGSRLFIGRGTVDTHVQHIYNKLNIDSRPQLAIWLMERGLLQRVSTPK